MAVNMSQLSDQLSPWSGSLPPIFRLQDASSPSSSALLSPVGVNIILYTNGCKQTNATFNCTVACQDNSQAFQTLETLHNCLYYIGISDAYARQALTNHDTKLADDLGIQRSESNSSVSQQVNSTITACFDAYYDGSLGYGKPIWIPDWELHFNDTYDFQDHYFGDGIDDLCAYIAPPTLNADIGGIGVYVSYWIQSGLAILGTFLVLLWGWGTNYIRILNIRGRHGNNVAKPAQGTSLTFETRRLAHLTAALTDFQKAQCFFMLAVNIAALANKANGGLLPVSLQQLYDNYSLLLVVAISGYLPVTTTLLALHMVDMISGYLLALSGCTVALSIATVAAIGRFKPTRGDLESIQAQASKGTHLECGNFNPTVYCLQYQGTDPSNTYVWGIMAYCLVVLFYIFAYRLNAFREPLSHQTRLWVLRMISCMISCMSSARTWQFVLTILDLVPWHRTFPDIILASLTLVYLAFLQICRFRCVRRINSRGSISIRCGFDLLACVSWLAVAAFSRNPFSFSIWATFTISAVHLLRKAFVENTKIRKVALKYQHFAYRDETLPRSSLGRFSIGKHLRRFSKIIMKAPVVLVMLTSTGIDNLEKRAADNDWHRKFKRFLVVCLYWMIFLGCIVSFVFLFLGLASFQAKVDAQTWTFGQIVAITVWAPPLCEYFHLELLGMTRGFQHRLLPPHKVVVTVTTAQPVP